MRPFALALAVISLCSAATAPKSAVAQADSGQCREPVGRDFAAAAPTGTGLSPKRLLELNDALDTEKYDIRALLIVRHCRLAFERYKHGLMRDHNHTTYSVTKSVVATLAGALLDQGRLASLDIPVATLLPKPPSMPPAHWQKAERITLRNAMQMSSGLAYRHDPHHPIYARDVDRFAVALLPRHTLAPGTRFIYSDGDASISGAAVAAAAGENLYRFAIRALFEPLEMANYDWPAADAAGRPPGGWGLRLRAMDMAKLGQLYLQRGEWNGQRLFAPEFVDVAWATGIVDFYGLHWWIGDALDAGGAPYFYAAGNKGQRVIVFPGLGLVAVLSASVPRVEAQAIDTLLIAALVEAAAEEVGEAAAAALMQRQARGFAGETRVEQTAEDRPRR